jgi:hypothetical protein
VYRLILPEWTDKNGDVHPYRELTVKLVDTLLGNFPPPADLIFKYYGIPPTGAFKATEHDRLVFWDDDIGYIVMPNAPINKGLWEKIDVRS